MALTKCPDCGKEVLDSAPACVQCGKPLGSGNTGQNVVQVVRKGGKLELAGFVLILLAIIMPWLGIVGASVGTPARIVLAVVGISIFLYGRFK